MRSEVAVDNDWRPEQWLKLWPSGMMGLRDMPWAALEGAQSVKFRWFEQGGRRRGPDVRVHQETASPNLIWLGSESFTGTYDSLPVTFLNPAANAVAVDTWYVIEASRVDLGHCTSAYWVDRLEDINAFGVRAWKKAKAWWGFHEGEPLEYCRCIQEELSAPEPALRAILGTCTDLTKGKDSLDPQTHA
ncbi:hypothetical protein BS47DRAFT_1396449 [Hydnum rufescens UP504]|uniref:Uncharacterized protein n=1 Tax=Hydnum rufescens UP504 TaxID=1448309 RepID=A0A9P6AQ65_9AGAM|nr:hypothetical protein BS47DRAFT_1396449 [Hydnum rufescens UP504]